MAALTAINRSQRLTHPLVVATGQRARAKRASRRWGDAGSVNDSRTADGLLWQSLIGSSEPDGCGGGAASRISEIMTALGRCRQSAFSDKGSGYANVLFRAFLVT
jgi:hypothetical protein